MGRFVAIQPDKKFAIWSTIVDDFIAEDMTEEEVVEFYKEESGRQAAEDIKSKIELLKKGMLPNAHYETYEGYVRWKFIVHGSNEERLDQFLIDCQGKTSEEIKKLLDTSHGDWMYWGEKALYRALLDYVPSMLGVQETSETFEESKKILEENNYFGEENKGSQ